MAVNGYLSVEFEIESRANVFFEKWFKMLHVSEGNGKVDCFTENKKTTLRIAGFKITEWNNPLREVILDTANQELNGYTRLEGTITVTPVEGNKHGSVKWEMDYEKTSPDIEDPYRIFNTFLDLFKLG